MNTKLFLEDGEETLFKVSAKLLTKPIEATQKISIQHLVYELKKVFPDMVRIDDVGNIEVMSKIIVEANGIVHGQGPASDRVREIVNESMGYRQEGDLVITNNRMLFIQIDGLLNVNTPIENIIAANKFIGSEWIEKEVKKLFGTKVVRERVKYGGINIQTDKGIFKYRLFTQNNIHNLINVILNSSSDRKLKIKESKSKIEVIHKGAVGTYDFNKLVNKLSEKGISLNTIECPNCGGTLEVPKIGNIFTCKYCQKNVYAVDLFKKFNTFIGD